MRGQLLPAAPVTCVVCASDGFAVGDTRQDALTTQVHEVAVVGRAASTNDSFTALDST